jgi:hypothetical protein
VPCDQGAVLLPAGDDMLLTVRAHEAVPPFSTILFRCWEAVSTVPHQYPCEQVTPWAGPRLPAYGRLACGAGWKVALPILPCQVTEMPVDGDLHCQPAPLPWEVTGAGAVTH